MLLLSTAIFKRSEEEQQDLIELAKRLQVSVYSPLIHWLTDVYYFPIVFTQVCSRALMPTSSSGSCHEFLFISLA